LGLLFRSQVEQNRIDVAASDFSDRLLRRKNLPNAVAGLSENLLQNIAEGFVGIDEKDAFYSFP